MSRTGRFITGFLVFAAGAAVTVLTYLNASSYLGGRYFIAWGAIVTGLVRMVRALLARDDGPQTAVASGDNEQPWSAGEALGVAMGALKKWHVLVVLPYLLSFIASTALGAVVGWALRGAGASLGAGAGAGGFPAGPKGVSLLGPAMGAGVGFFVFAFALGPICAASLAAVRGQSPSGWPSALRAAPRLLLFQLLMLPLTLVAWSPLGIVILPFVLTPFFVVDQKLPVVEAMRQSWRASKQSFGALWLFHLALLPISLVGLVTGFATLLTVPLYYLGLAYGYVRVTGKSEIPWFPPEYASRSYRSFLKLTLGLLTLVLGALVYWVKLRLPTMRGSAWSIQDTSIRASAIVTGVAVVIVLLALLLPYMLDRLEGRRFTSFVAARHVRSQKSGFLTVISVLSICGVAISSCALSSVVSVMGGFSQDLKRKILGNNAHIVIDTTAGVPFADYEAVLGKVRGIPGVVGAAPVVHGEVMASSASNLAGVIVTGVEPSSIKSVIELVNNIEVGKLDYLEHPERLTKLPPNEVIGIGPGGEQYYKGADLPGLPDDIDPSVRAVIINKPERPGIILGRELAKTLHVYVGDEITLVSPLGDLGPMGVMPRTKKFRVAGIFYSGMYEYDATYVYTMMDVAAQYFQLGDSKVTAIEVKVDDAERSEKITDQVTAAIARPDLRVRDWREINKNLFSALKLERLATFIILSIAIMVASFCIVCTLLLMVTEKGKEIAILKAIGASDGAILRIFMIEGMIIGGIGTVFGVVTGLSVCTGLSWFGLRLDPEVYYIDRLPISVNPADFATVAAAAIIICTLSTLYPAFAASRLRPVDGLRYE